MFWCLNLILSIHSFPPLLFHICYSLFHILCPLLSTETVYCMCLVNFCCLLTLTHYEGILMAEFKVKDNIPCSIYMAEFKVKDNIACSIYICFSLSCVMKSLIMGCYVPGYQTVKGQNKLMGVMVWVSVSYRVKHRNVCQTFLLTRSCGKKIVFPPQCLSPPKKLHNIYFFSRKFFH